MMSREEYRDKIRALLRELNEEFDEDDRFPDEVIETVVKPVRPSVALIRQDGGAAAQFGGNPRLPADAPWPTASTRQTHRATPVPFAASVHCSMLPREGLDIDVPQDGHLLYFCSFVDDDQRGQVIYVPAGTPVAERAAPEHSGAALDSFETIRMGAAVQWTLPGGSDPYVYEIDAEAPAGHPYIRYWEADIDVVARSAYLHSMLQIGGYVSSPKEHPVLSAGGYYPEPAGDPRDQGPDEANRRARWYRTINEEWVVLTEMSFDQEFADKYHRLAGNAFWTIRRADLAARRFDKIKYRWEIRD